MILSASPCSMVLLLILRLFDNQEKSCFSFHTPCHTRCIPDPYPKHVFATTSPCVWHKAMVKPSCGKIQPSCEVCVCVCACVCSWTCSCRVPSKESKLHWYNITVNRLWSALINSSRGYEAETLHKCSRSRLRITAERPISDYWPVAIYIYISLCVCDLLPRPVPWSPAWAHDPYPQSSLIFHGALLCFCFVILSLSPLLDGAAVGNQTFW